MNNREEWLEKRRKSIGASDAPAVMEESPWVTPFQLWTDKVFGSRQEDNPAMERGRLLEPVALKLFEDITGHWMIPTWMESKERPYMTANLDGFDPVAKIAMEIKCPGFESHQKAVDGQVPAHYIAQLQHQMFVAELRDIYYFSYHPDHEKKSALLLVQRDEIYLKTLLEKEEAFWDMVLTRQAPPLTPRDKRCLPVEWKGKLERMTQLEDMLKGPQDELDRLKDWLRGEATCHYYEGSGYKVKVVPRKGGIDYSAIPELKDVDLEAYRKESTKMLKIERLE